MHIFNNIADEEKEKYIEWSKKFFSKPFIIDEKNIILCYEKLIEMAIDNFIPFGLLGNRIPIKNKEETILYELAMKELFSIIPREERYINCSTKDPLYINGHRKVSNSYKEIDESNDLLDCEIYCLRDYSSESEWNLDNLYL
jgi:hypothetical protein